MASGTLVPILIFLIPILGIVLAGYKEWLSFKAKQQELGASTQEVEATIQALRSRLDEVEQERDALVRRVQNLETIVTSEAWDARSANEPPALSEENESAVLDPAPSHDDSETSTQEQADALARRLRS